MLLSFSNNFKSKKFITSIFLLFNFIIADPTDGCDIDDFSLFLTSDGQVLYNSSQSIAGFQFDVDGGNNTSIGNAYGGDAQQAGFTVSAGNSTVIGFSFTGSTISAGCGTLTNLEISGPFSGLSSIIISDASGVGLDFSYYNGGSDDGGDPCDLIDCATGYICDDGECICNAEEDCFGECGGNGVVDDCGVCGGDGSSCSDDGGDFNGFTLSVVDNDTYFDSDSEAAVVITLENEDDVAGFQFVLWDDPDVLSYVDIYGTDRTEGFTISASEGEAGVTLLGFSFSGATIAPGHGPILVIQYNTGSVLTDTIVDLNISASILSDPDGIAINHESENNILFLSGSDPILGCTDQNACNFDIEANTNDGSCEYPEENYNCSGDCIVDIDCAGDCGGNLEYDECGVCDGNNDSCTGCMDSLALNFNEDATISCNDCCDYEDFNGIIVINEINYNPALSYNQSDADYEFIELYNNSNFNVNLNSWNLVATNIDFTFGQFTLGANDYIVLARNSETYAGSISHEGTSLLNGGDSIVLSNSNGDIVDNVLYADDESWPQEADASGSTLELINPNLDNSIAQNWQASYVVPGGTPGYQNSTAPDPIPGCMDENACNFNADATIDNDSCEYPEENFNCNGDCIADIDCSGTCGGVLEYDDCGVCDGDGPSFECWNGSFACNTSDCPEEPVSEVIEILYDSDADIYGFQFSVSGVDIINAGSGSSAESGFTVSNSGTTVIGFSLQGNYVEAGSGVLVLIEVEGDVSDACLDNVIVSGQGGVALSITVEDCFTINYQLNEDIFGCTNEEACNYNPAATVDDDSCEYSEENYDCNGDCIADIDCSGTCGGVLEYDDCGVCDGDGPGFECWNGSFACNASDCPDEPISEVIEILYDSDADIYGFQFSVSGVNIINAGSGVSAESGFTVSNSGTTVIGFSMQGNYVEAGSGVLVLIEVEGDVSDACLDNVIVSGQGGVALSITVEDCFTINYQLNEDIFGCTNEEACNYNPAATVDNDSCEYPEENYDCDGNCLLDVDCTGDCGGQAQEDECGICNGDNSSCTGCLDEEALNYNSDALIQCDDCCVYYENNNYIVDLTDTGESSLVIIQSTEGLDVGDEIGLFDEGGIVESCDPSFGCEDIVVGEVLVGSGIWTDEQLEIVAIGSVDLSQFGGPTLNGYVSGNDIKIKVWKNSTQMEYDINVLYQVGDGIWGQILTVISNLEPIFTIIQPIELDPYQINMVSLNVYPNNNNLVSIMSDINVLLVSNDQSDFYVPEYNVNQIDVWENTEGLSIVLNGTNSQVLLVEGVPIETNTVIELEPFRMNLLPYLLQECISTSDAFAGVEDNLLVVKNDDSEYYVPAFGVQTLTEMCPGESYAVFLHGSEGLEFVFPTGVMSSNHSNHFVEDYKSRTRTNDVDLTGESHLVLLSEISGEVSVGDQLRAYANNQLVGSINIVEEHLNGTHPVDLVAVGSVDLTEFAGPILDGYIPGDMIELRLWSINKAVELKVSADLSDMQYGNAMELSTGVASVLNEGAIVTSLSLTQNYPNPFNPSTTISYNVDASGMVTLKVYDVMGRLVRTLVDGYKISGYESGYSVVWDGKDQQGQQVSAGLYIYSLQTPTGIKTKKMVLLK